MDHLFNNLSIHFQVPTEAKVAMEQLFIQQHFLKNDFLVSEGQVCRDLYFIEKGCIRGFYNIDGRDISQWFGFENDFATSFHSFIGNNASREYIQVLEDATLWSISKQELDALLIRFPVLEKLLRLIYEHYYIRLEDRYSNAHFKTATQRYEELIINSSHIVQRVPLGYIASFLGISAETLSRIRAKDKSPQ